MTRPDFTAVQLTDTHLRAAGEKVRGEVDTFENLVGVLDRLSASDMDVDAVILSGDLADDGDPAAYRRLRSVVEPAAEALGATVIHAMGNHDDRTAFRSELGQPFDSVHHVNGVRIVVLDSSIPNRHDGTLEDVQLDYLARELERPSERGTVVVLHHPPIPSPVVTVDHLRLQNPDRLEAAIAGSDVRIILCGHAHHTGAGSLGGVPVWVGPALSYQVDAAPPSGRHRGLTGYGFTRIDLFGESFVATAVDASPAKKVYDDARRDVLDMLAALSSQAG